jgi:uncharacterized protein YigA (DUF484 family)
MPRLSKIGADSAVTHVGGPSDPEGLRALVRENAEALRQDSDLLSELGLRLDVANIVDFGPIALARVSEAHRRESGERRRLEAVARANYAAQAQTHAAVIELLEAKTLEDLAQRLDEIARLRFGLAVGAIGLEGGGLAPARWAPLVEGQVDAILGEGRLARLGFCPTAAGLFGALAPQIGSCALLRLSIGHPPRGGVIAFGAFDTHAFTADMGPELVTFLARVLERTAERWTLP